MRLTDFLWEAEFDRLRKLIGAELVTTGLDISLDKIEYADDGTLEYEGQKVVVYIRDRQDEYMPKDEHGKRILDPEKLYKFHVANCDWLQKRRAEDTFGNYVVATRTDGKFVVNFTQGHKPVDKGVECRLYICKFCLSALDYKGTRESFNLKEFFETYNSQIIITPEHDDMTAPVNEYSSNWNQISQFYRKKVGWKCEECGINLREAKRFLHVHHINGLKYESTVENLCALCIGCHADQFQHEQIRSSPEYDEFLQWRDSLNPTNPW